MSLLDDVSIVVTPNGYKAGELYAVVPVPTEGAEEITNGDFSTDGTPSTNTWTLGWYSNTANVSISGGRITLTNSASESSSLAYATNGVSSNNILTTNQLYKLQYQVVANNGVTSFKYYSSGGSFIDAPIDLGVTHTIYIKNTTNQLFLFQNATTNSNISLDNVSVKEWTSSDMDVTRATAATRVDEDGLVNYAVGSELVTDGNFPTGTTAWTFGNVDWTLGGGVAAWDGAATYTWIAQTIGYYVGKQVKVTFDAVINSGNLYLVVANGGATPSITTSGSYEFILTPTGGGVYDSQVRVYQTVADSDFTITNISIKEVTNVPRIDYTGGGCPHILSEPQRTNLITQNNQFDTTWVTSNLSLTSGQNGIYNTTDAWLFNATNSLANVTISVSTSGENTYSVYAKAGTEDGVFIRFTGGSNPRAFFNLTNGTLISESGTTNTNVENVGNGWYRCSVTGSETITDARIYVSDSSGNFVSSGNIYVQYSQLENGSYSTSIIPTSGSTVTRNQDIFTRDGIGSLINDSEGVLFAEIAALDNDGTFRMIAISDGTIDNVVNLYYRTDINKITIRLKSGATQEIFEMFDITATNFNKVAFRYKSGESNLFINGVKQKVSDYTATNMPVGLSQLTLDSGGNTNFFYGKVKQLQVYNTALTDEQLLQLTGTSGTDFYESYAEMASALTYTIQ